MRRWKRGWDFYFRKVRVCHGASCTYPDHHSDGCCQWEEVSEARSDVNKTLDGITYPRWKMTRFSLQQSNFEQFKRQQANIQKGPRIYSWWNFIFTVCHFVNTILDVDFKIGESLWNRGLLCLGSHWVVMTMTLTNLPRFDWTWLMRIRKFVKIIPYCKADRRSQ